MSAVMTTLAREEELGGHDPTRQSFFSSHPTSPERAEITRVRARLLMRGPGEPIVPSARTFLDVLDGLAIGPSAAQGSFDGNRFLHPELDFTLEMPSDWRTDNTPTAVSAVSPDGASAVLVTLVTGTGDPLEAATEARAGGKLDFKADPERVEVSGLPAVRAIGAAGDRSERVGLLVYWIAHDDRIYRIVGAAPRASFAERRSVLDRAARSFRPLAPADRALIRQARLRIFEAAAGDTLERLVERHSSSWSPEEAAVANGLEVNGTLAAGQAVKLAILEAYDSR
jgi:predicted Zn-dependent protease